MMYFGQDQHAIDSKGRVNIPARHRRTAGTRGCTEFWFAPGFGPYVVLWDSEGFKALATRLSALPAGNRKAMDLRRRIYSNACLVEPDGQGRVVIPDHLRKSANLEGQVVILGVEDHLELWDPKTYEEYIEGTQESLAEMANELPF